MRVRAFLALGSMVPVTILMWDGCGYVGPVQPPSPQIPTAIIDLAVVERGEKLVFTFTAPPRTTDGVAITQFTSIDLRVAPVGQPPDTGKAYEVDLPPPSDREDPQPKPITYQVAASDWSSQKVSVAVRTAAKKATHFSAWSNRVAVEVIQPLEPPSVRVSGSAKGIVLNWDAEAGVQYKVQRQGPADKQPLELATSNAAPFVDASAAYDTEYHYVVTATKANAESLPSKEVTYSATDTYAPAVPSGLTALAGPDAVGLAWQRNTEPDLQGYFVYRSNNNGPFLRLSVLVTLPAYSDHAVEHGKTYIYKVSAIDQKGNESAQSSPAEAAF